MVKKDGRLLTVQWKACTVCLQAINGETEKETSFGRFLMNLPPRNGQVIAECCHQLDISRTAL